MLTYLAVMLFCFVSRLPYPWQCERNVFLFILAWFVVAEVIFLETPCIIHLVTKFFNWIFKSTMKGKNQNGN